MCRGAANDCGQGLVTQQQHYGWNKPRYFPFLRSESMRRDKNGHGHCRSIVLKQPSIGAQRGGPFTCQASIALLLEKIRCGVLRVEGITCPLCFGEEATCVRRLYSTDELGCEAYTIER